MRALTHIRDVEPTDVSVKGRIWVSVRVAGFYETPFCIWTVNNLFREEAHTHAIKCMGKFIEVWKNELGEVGRDSEYQIITHYDHLNRKRFAKEPGLI